MRPNTSPRKGLTLIELVLVIAISTVILLLMVLAYLVGIRSLTQETSRFDLYWDGNRVIQDMAEEVRNCLNVNSADSSSISIWWDDVNDNGTMEADEVVSYVLSDHQLVRSRGSESRVLAKNVAGFNLSYDNPGYPTLVTITLTMGKEGNIATLETKADIRSR
jgi:prepilin-type N-terminal cleavage/methylation domain-containing protein